LPTGTLLAQDPVTGKYYALNFHSTTWRLVPPSEVLTNASIVVAGGTVYWVRSTLNQASSPTPPHLLAVPATRY
jgi:hypothetical protein